MPLWLYNLPEPTFALIVVGGIIAISLAGFFLTRPLARRLFGEPPAYNDLVGDILQAACAFYGITLGLIAIGAWSATDKASDIIGKEAAELGGLYRDVSCLPDPLRSDLQDNLRRYTRYVIDEAWPLQQQGKVPSGNVARMSEFLARLRTFKPADAAEQVFMQCAFEQFNKFYEARRMRLQAGSGGLPSVLWVIVIVGAAINITLTWCFVMERTRAHALFVFLLSALIALLIFVTAAMDNPFLKAFGLGPEPYELTYQQLMQPAPPAPAP